MNTQEAKDILLLYRPGTRDAEDPQIREAMAVAREDPDLASWFERHCAFQTAIRARLRELQPPARLREALLRESKVVRPAFRWRQPAWLAAAACFAVMLGLAALWHRPQTPDTLADFEARMHNIALREYRMDIVTHDMRELRQFLASRGAPSDYELPPGLGQVPLTGGGRLRWRSNAVSMVCFNRGDDQMLFLFVVARGAVSNPPPDAPLLTAEGPFQKARWSRGDKTYFLLGPTEPEFERKYL